MQNSNLCTIIIPLLNEEQIISESLIYLEKLQKEFQFLNFLFVDCGSSDNTKKILLNLTDKIHLNFNVLYENFTNPSVAYAIQSGLKIVTSKYVLILPIDCFLSVTSFNEAFLVMLKGVEWGGFKKKYIQVECLYKFYGLIQNIIRTRCFGNYVWTNGIFGKTELIKSSLQTPGFLEDILLSDELKRKAFPHFINAPLVVSNRKYSGRKFEQIFLNFWILVLFRLKLKSIQELRKMY